MTLPCYRGITWRENSQKWEAQMRFQGRKLYLGLHSTPEAAARAYDDAVRMLRLKGRRLNFPEVAG